MTSFRGIVHAWNAASQRVAHHFRGLARPSCRAPVLVAPVAVANAGAATTRPAIATPWLQATRQFTTYSPFNSNPRTHYQSFRFKTKFFHHYFRTRAASPILRGAQWHSFVFHNFSQAYSNTYRLRLHTSSLNFTTKTFFNRIRRSFGVAPSASYAGQKVFVPQPTVSVAIRLNRELTPANHRITLSLAKRESEAKVVSGCYLEFRLDCKVAIPRESLYTEDTQSEIKRSLDIQRRRLALIEDSLDKLADIGQLPITCDDQVIRFYFANCDRARLEALLLEREIAAGVIVEDYDAAASASAAATQAAEPVSEWDVLSSSGYLTSASSASSSADTAAVLSDDSHLATALVTPDFAAAPPAADTVEISHDFHWV
ncbi:hypothetical protein DIURU_003782 [Diutina rugosa]|uniref:Stationary phase protein 5 n=1 Tax=Diutina rugosa TaxID=5481 RepID=A0A642URE6_DIURU|nr:uncharacterized protein DIURU_003782 [Diutina rugosa]KAA8900359.1 hypothetical protein DIURU_003782 [Diutina rugosa]